jgi:Fungal specific transcription factor domain
VTHADNERRRYSVHDFAQHTFIGTSISAASQPPSFPIKGLKRDSEDEDDDDEDDEDDPWDVEMELSQPNQIPSGDTQRELSMMLSRHATQDVARLRTFNTFLDSPNVLATYRPSPSSSPLTNEETARIFCHFVHVTGPCISIFERQASNLSISFHNSPVPQFPKTLWTYTLPSMALSHPPLMHAVLALSSLHIAKLQQTSDAPSMKHFMYALRRVSKLIGLPKRRNEIPTLAATLLIGFYEILLADHSKWNIHLKGASILVMEIDFAGMTRRLRRMRAEARERTAHTSAFSYEDYVTIAGVPETLLPDKDWEVDEGLIKQLTGLPVNYDNQWQARTNMPVPTHDLSAKDIEDYKVKSDLFWWYCKQDVFQSMVSGNRLLMPYEHWIYCPPRGPIGKLETTYATMDYLCLLMARLTDFGGKDQLRKRKVVAAQGGQWRPPPNFFGPGNPPAEPPPPKPPASQAVPTDRPASTPAHRTPGHGISDQYRPPSMSAPTQPTSLPPPSQAQPRGQAPTTSGGPMYGMMPPPTGPIQMHSAFHVMSANIHDTGYIHPAPYPSSQTPSQPSDNDLSAATANALQEHASITAAFDLFHRLLSNPEYAPLTPDTTPPVFTPFGAALQYRTYPISCIWAFYHVGRILLHRLHPHMPPAAMVSAGVSAHLTRNDAQTVGRICAGLYLASAYSLQNANLNPSLGSALMESSFSLFFAAIQFQDATQREWTISKLRDVARIAGWQSGAAIAAGCEVCWERMGEAGKGPKYVPKMDRGSKDERIAGRVRRGEASGERGAGWGSGVKAEGLGRAQAGVENDLKEEVPDLSINHDRRFINVNANARVHWALGILGMEDDMARLDLDKA